MTDMADFVPANSTRPTMYMFKLSTGSRILNRVITTTSINIAVTTALAISTLPKMLLFHVENENKMGNAVAAMPATKATQFRTSPYNRRRSGFIICLP